MMAWWKAQIDWLKGFVSEKDGKASNKRLCNIAIVGVFCWSYLKIAWDARTLLDIPTNWSILLPMLLGLAIAGNYAMKKINGQDNAG